MQLDVSVTIVYANLRRSQNPDGAPWGCRGRGEAIPVRPIENEDGSGSKPCIVADCDSCRGDAIPVRPIEMTDDGDSRRGEAIPVWLIENEDGSGFKPCIVADRDLGIASPLQQPTHPTSREENGVGRATNTYPPPTRRDANAYRRASGSAAPWQKSPHGPTRLLM